jgi:hypothetical protein
VLSNGDEEIDISTHEIHEATKSHWLEIGTVRWIVIGRRYESRARVDPSRGGPVV